MPDVHYRDEGAAVQPQRAGSGARPGSLAHARPIPCGARLRYDVVRTIGALELFRHGCDPRLQPPDQCRTRGGACAVSFVTPMIDDNRRTLSEFGRDCTVNDTSTTCSALPGRPHYSSAMVSSALINLGVEEFRAMPSWRPASSLFHSQEHAPPGVLESGWSRGALREGFDALRSLSVWRRTSRSCATPEPGFEAVRPISCPPFTGLPSSLKLCSEHLQLYYDPATSKQAPVVINCKPSSPPVPWPISWDSQRTRMRTTTF